MTARGPVRAVRWGLALVLLSLVVRRCLRRLLCIGEDLGVHTLQCVFESRAPVGDGLPLQCGRGFGQL